jgi:hypothetical protein
MRSLHLKGMRRKSNVRYKYYLIFYFFIRLNITTSNACAFKEFLCPLSLLPNSTTSWRMRIMCTPKGVMKMLGRVLSIETYGTIFLFC